jgi:hypothetical protein
MALTFAGMLNAIGVDSQVYAPSLSSHWPSCMQEAVMWPTLDLPPFQRGEWHVPSRHVAEAYALAAKVEAIRDVFDGVLNGEATNALAAMAVGPESAFSGPLQLGRQPVEPLLSRQPTPQRTRSRSPRRGGSWASPTSHGGGVQGFPELLPRPIRPPLAAPPSINETTEALSTWPPSTWSRHNWPSPSGSPPHREPEIVQDDPPPWARLKRSSMGSAAAHDAVIEVAESEAAEDAGEGLAAGSEESGWNEQWWIERLS